MKKKRIIAEVAITEMAFPNKGIGRFNGSKVVVKNALPGQTLELALTKKKGVFHGRVMSVLKPSPMEIPPLCPHFAHCGGCATQHITYADELKLKEKMVLKLFADATIDPVGYDGMVPAPCLTAYRNKMEFSFGDEKLGGALMLGMRQRNSFYEVASAEHCNIVDTDFCKILTCVRDFFRVCGETFYHKKAHTGALRHLVVRKGFFTGEILVNLVTTSALISDLSRLAATLQTLPLKGEIVGILHTQNDAVADVVRADVLTILFGRDYFYEKLLGLTFKISAFSFFQTNSAGAEKLYETVREYLGNPAGKTVFDLYCGTGTIAQIAAQTAKAVVGVELIEEAVRVATENAAANGLDNCCFIMGDVLRAVDTLDKSPDVIILDPPREGVHPKAMPKIIGFGAPQIIYISCKPSSLTRDLEVFRAHGYTLSALRLHDMFPRTAHVEAIVLLQRQDT